MATKNDLRRKGPRPSYSESGLFALQLAFLSKFGRFPGGKDPVFFDPGADNPQSLSIGDLQRYTVESMLYEHTPPQAIYAYMKCGFLVSEETQKTLPQENVVKWEKAVDEFFMFVDKLGSTQH